MSVPVQFLKVKQIDYAKLEKPKVSIILCTFREHPKFELLYESLSHQTLQNFELVISDYLCETRKDYIQDLSRKWKIPTVHIPRDKYGVKAFNIGMANAGGDYMIHINDANYFHNRFIEKHLITAMNGFLSYGTRYFIYDIDFPIEKHLTASIETTTDYDDKLSEYINKQSNGIPYYLHLNFGEHKLTSPQDFRLLGIPLKFLEEDNVILEGAPGWSYGGNICGPTKLFLKINGFDEEFDKGYGWSDCNLGVRAFNAGYKSYMNISNWTLEIHDQDHSSVYDLFPNYKTEEASKHNWMLYEKACNENTIRANPHFDLKEIREKNLRK